MRKYPFEMTDVKGTEEIDYIHLTFRQKVQRVNEGWKKLNDFMFMFSLGTLE